MPRAREMFVVDAFSDRPFCGNPAVIVPDAEGLSEREFTSRYRGERAGAYDALVEEIDRRIETVWRGSGLFSTDSAFAVPGLRPQAWHR